MNAEQNPPLSKCCVQAPAVIEFDLHGNFVQGWGGPGEGYDWPKNEHGIYVEREGNVWIAGNDTTDDQVLKFTRERQVPDADRQAGQGPKAAAAATQLAASRLHGLDRAANELYVADGYGNRRVIVFDAKTGAYKRHWGAYGNAAERRKAARLSTRRPRPRRSSSQRCIACASSRDGLLYVCDRDQRPIQVFNKDGTFREGVLRRAQHAAPAARLRHRILAGPAADVPLRRRRTERRSARASRALTASRWEASGAPGAWPASSGRCTTWRATRRATSIPPRPAPVAESRSSCVE